MTVRTDSDGIIHLEGLCGIDDAEPLLLSLLASPSRRVAWSLCEHAHMAIIQLLLLAQPSMEGPAMSAFLQQHVAPLLSRQPASRKAAFTA
ncbi:MAG: hypothetical protein B7Z15_02245 [Rhizobiales bacterium 32-66-8]|nr:MAG: hypothetical protein B7Z15_02245 [Rhizobiales bacterium 32-66-8]